MDEEERWMMLKTFALAGAIVFACLAGIALIVWVAFLR